MNRFIINNKMSVKIVVKKNIAGGTGGLSGTSYTHRTTATTDY
jgi:hypothetical protein